MSAQEPNKTKYLTTKEQHEVDEYVADFVRSGEFSEVIRAENFSQSVSVCYMDDEDDSVLITEHPDGKIVREQLPKLFAKE